jgi:hypothetical protein
MDRRGRRSRVVLGALVVGVFALSACSGDDDGPTEGASPGSSTTTTAPGGGGSSSTTEPGGGGGGEGEGCEGGTPVWAVKSTQLPGIQEDEDESDQESTTTTDGEGGGGGSEDECEEGPVLGEGELQITLRWEGNADYDLHVIEPDGTEIDYTNRGPTESGGQLDVDSNIGCVDNGGVENVYWEDGQMPNGHYTVKVVGFSVDGCEGGEYELTVKVRGEEVLTETGTVGEDEEDSYEFDAE